MTLNDKHVHYGEIWDCPHAGLLIATRMLDKTRRLVQLEYLQEVLKDFGDIQGVKERIGDIHKIEEDTLGDLEGYITQYKRGGSNADNNNR